MVELPEPSSAADQLAHRVIGAAIQVHRVLGPGLLESLYEEALSVEFEHLGIPHQRQVSIPATYRNRVIGRFRCDLVADGRVLVEIKAATGIANVHVAQVITYLKLLNLELGLLLNFNRPTLAQGIRRVIPGSSGVSPSPAWRL